MAVPRSPAVTLSDSDYRYAARHRMGLYPDDDLPATARAMSLLGTLPTSTRARD